MKKSYLHSYFLHWICDDQRFEYVKIYSANPLYLVFIKVNGSFEEITKNEYLTLAPTNESEGKIRTLE